MLSSYHILALYTKKLTIFLNIIGSNIIIAVSITAINSGKIIQSILKTFSMK